ncbi:MAG: PocR ligand-binding domain-containing protein [Desulfobacterales bacterium]|nr:PocR ligand-binding domain-containing protein [Desulfobacterales bacterium]
MKDRHSPEIIEKLQLAEIIDSQALQSMMDDFYSLVRIPMRIIDLRGKVLGGVGRRQDICVRFHRAHPETCKHCIESDMRLSAGIPQGEFRLHKCLNNMRGIATPLFVCGKHMGNVFSGHFHFDDEPVDYDLFRSQARKYGFDENEYMAALESVPRLRRSQVEAGMSFFIKIADVITSASYDNINLAQSLVERDALMVSLRESRKDLNRAQAVAHTGSWRMNVGRNELTWSDETYRIFGIPEGTSLTYEKFLSLVHPKDREYVDREWAAALRGELYEIEHRIIVGDTMKWVREKAELEFDKGGLLLGGFGTVQDITERKLAEANRALLADTLRILNRGGDLHLRIAETLGLIRDATGFDAVGLRLRMGEDCPYFEHKGFSEEFLREENSLCVKSLDGKILYDAEGRAVLECTCGLILSGLTDPGMSCFTEGGSFWTNNSHKLLALTREADPRTNPRNRCIHAGYESVGLFPVRSGREITGLLQLNGCRAGRFTPGLIAFYETLAQNIGLALQRTMAEESLRESEEKYKNLYDEAPVGYVELDSEGRINRVNRKMAEMLGYAAEEMLGKHMWNFVVEKREAEEAIRAKLSGYELPSDALERTYKRKDGPLIPVLIKDRVARNSEGKVTRIRVTVQDITERKQMEDVLRRSRDELELRVRERTAELESKNRELQEFTYIASHDLSEPLRKVETFGNLLMAKKADWLDDEGKDFISRMTGAATRMKELIDALLRYSRVETQGRDPVPVNLNNIAQTVASDLEVSIKKTGAHVEIGPLPIINGDPYQLRQLFQNLLSNSLKYCRSEVKPLVKIHGDERDGICTISVEDNGIGFDEKYLEKIFQPFQRLHGRNEYPGIGIGLAACKKIVERHRGTITASSIPGKGSIFIVTLPVDDSQIAAERP